MSSSDDKKEEESLNTKLLIARSDNFWHTVNHLLILLSKATIPIVLGICFIFFVYFGIYRTAEVLGGKDTNVSFFYKLISEVNISVAISWSLTAAFGYWGYSERRARHKERDELCEQIKTYQLEHDPNLSSSNMSLNGEKVINIENQPQKGEA